MRRFLRWALPILLIGAGVGGSIATDNISDESYTGSYGLRSRVTGTDLGYRYFEARPITADTDLSTVDTLRVVRDFNGDSVVDSVGASTDYAAICRIVVWSNAAPAAEVDSFYVKWHNGTAAGTSTVTDSVIGVFYGTAETKTPARHVFDVRADFATIGTGATVGTGDLWVIAYCER